MGLLLSFSPFIAFALLERAFGPVAGLAAGALVSAALVAREKWMLRRSPKLLELGSLALFAALALVAAFGHFESSVIGVRLVVDSGLLLIALLSLLLRRPFTLQYARERVTPEIAAKPGFFRSNVMITAAWTLAFAVMVLADMAMLHGTQAAHRIGMIATFGALLGAFKFTSWYPRRHAKA